MLRIYPVVLDVVRDLKPAVDAIAQRDSDLAGQMRSALQSVVLNISEGMGSRAGIRRARYQTALGSIREVLACIDVGAIFGYVPPLSPEAANRCGHVVGTLVRLTT